jgi:hypothetical protein
MGHRARTRGRRAGIEVLELDKVVLRADDGIRTRDPHLGKVLIGLQGTSGRTLTCGSVHPVVRRIARFPIRCRAVYHR